MADELLPAIAGWGLAGAPSMPSARVTTAAILPAVLQHKLIGVLEAMLRAGDVRVDDEASISGAHADAMAEALLLEDVLLQAIDILDAAGVDWRLLKGAALAHTVHPDPAQRSFGDNDLMIQGDQIATAIDVLTAAGARRLQPRLSPLFDRRFTKSVTLAWLSGTELDLHRTLAPGPFGLRIVTGDLFDEPSVFELAGRTVATLPLELHLAHGAIHLALGDVDPRLGSVRDVALLLENHDIDSARVCDLARRWRCELPVAIGIRAAAGIGAADHPLLDWARSVEPSAADRRLLESYRQPQGRFRAQAKASLRVLGWRDRVAYTWAITRRR